MSAMLEPVPDGPELPGGPFTVPQPNTLPMPRLLVWGPGEDEPPYEVTVYTADVVNYEETAAKHGWPIEMDKAGSRGGTYLAWRASRRAGHTDLSWDAFKAAVRFVKDIGVSAATPTVPGPDPG